MENPNKQQVIEQRILAQHQLIAQRLQENPEHVITHAKNNLQRWKKNYDDVYPAWFVEWQNILSKPVTEIIKLLTSEDPHAVQLRSSSPFAGVISSKERWNLIRDIQ